MLHGESRRARLAAFHPATVRELGFEASLRAAVTPFPAAQAIRLSIRTAVEDFELLVPIAQELVVNAVKHAAPRAIDVVVERVAGPPPRRGRRRDPLEGRPPGNTKGPGLNARGRSLDACSITSWTLPPYRANRPREATTPKAVATADGGEGGSIVGYRV
jgi:hypothetical protein